MNPPSEIERILSSGRSARDPEVEQVSESQLRSAEDELGFRFPASYREFVKLGGLSELRISHEVLGPVEIVSSLPQVDGHKYVPFADNQCGDLYCWVKAGDAEPLVVFADHETGEYIANAASFTAWLEANRF
ncbi:MAG: SMI1/KNR4 family protein [Rhizobacter sp.]|nr:SMI1/KNR4 family protein [Rhizobacter sp.]